MENESTRQSAVEAILERNPNAFRPKIQAGASVGYRGWHSASTALAYIAFFVAYTEVIHHMHSCSVSSVLGPVMSER